MSTVKTLKADILFFKKQGFTMAGKVKSLEIELKRKIEQDRSLTNQLRQEARRIKKSTPASFERVSGNVVKKRKK